MQNNIYLLLIFLKVHKNIHDIELEIICHIYPILIYIYTSITKIL